jgi:hypothetical protein
MAAFFPLYYESGSIRSVPSSSLLNYLHFPHFNAGGGLYVPSWNDPYYFISQSSNITNSSTTASSSIATFNLLAFPEKQYFTTDVILGVQSVNAASRIQTKLESNGDNFYTSKIASSLTAFSIYNKGSADTAVFLTSSLIAANTTYPSNIKGILATVPNSVFSSSLFLMSVTASQEVRAMSGSIWYNLYSGYSSSRAPSQSSAGALAISGSNIIALSRQANQQVITSSVLLITPTGSNPWTSSILGTAVNNASNTTFVQAFSLTGMTDNRTYLVNFYLYANSAATTTGFRLRAINGTNYRGSIYTPGTTVTLPTANSQETGIIQTASLAFPTTSVDRLVFGEYLVTKTAGTNPTIDIISEINTSNVQANVGSVAFWREIPQNKEAIVSPLTIFSSSISSYKRLDQTLQFYTNNLRSGSNFPGDAGNTDWQFLIKTGSTLAINTTSPVTASDFKLTLNTNTRYIIVGYLGGASNNSTIGIRSDIVTSSITKIAYSIEIPTSTTAVGFGNNQSPNTTSAPVSNINNHFLIKTTALVTTDVAGSPQYVPSIYSEVTGGTASLGPSILFYKAY